MSEIVQCSAQFDYKWDGYMQAKADGSAARVDGATKMPKQRVGP